MALSVTDSSDVFYTDPSNKGGNVKLDVGVWDWDSQLSAGKMEDYKLIVESNVLTTPATFSSMTPTGGGSFYSTYHVEIPANNVQSSGGNEYWVILEHSGFDYTNPYNVPNQANTDPLAAFFRYDLKVGAAVPAWIKVIQPNGGESLMPGTTEEIKWTSSGVTGTVFIDYSKDNFVSDIHSISTGEANDGSYMWTVPCDASNNVRVRVSSTLSPTVNDTSDADFTIIGSGWADKWGDTGYEEGRGARCDSQGDIYISGTSVYVPTGRNYAFISKFDPCGQLLWSKKYGGNGLTQGYGCAVDSSGNVYATGNFYGTTDFDPDNPGGPAQITLVGGSSWDAFLDSFDKDGKFRWVRTWGGTYSDSGQGACVDASNNVYVSGFYSKLVDFKPGGGDPHQSNTDSFDCFVCSYDSTGAYRWARTWGSVNDDRAWGVAAGANNVYTVGYFAALTNFNESGPPSSYDIHGGNDIFLNTFDQSGVYQWTKTWGGPNDDGSTYGMGYQGVAANSAGDVYVASSFSGSNVNLNPDGSDLHSSHGALDSSLSKWNSSGTFQWARTWGGGMLDTCRGGHARLERRSLCRRLVLRNRRFQPVRRRHPHSQRLLGGLLHEQVLFRRCL